MLGDERGAVMAEYALVLALLSIVMMAGLSTIDTVTVRTLNDVEKGMLDYGLEITP